MFRVLLSLIFLFAVNVSAFSSAQNCTLVTVETAHYNQKQFQKCNPVTESICSQIVVVSKSGDRSPMLSVNNSGQICIDNDFLNKNKNKGFAVLIGSPEPVCVNQTYVNIEPNKSGQVLRCYWGG